MKKRRNLKNKNILKDRIFWFLVLIVLIASLSGFLAGVVLDSYFYTQIRDYLGRVSIELPQPLVKIEKERIIEYQPQTTQEEAIINVVKEFSPAVVSIIITKDVPIIEEYYADPFKELEEFFGPTPFEFKIPQYRQKGVEKQEIGGGTGFMVSEDGMVLTNKHVVLDEEADYTIFTTDGRKFPAKVLAKDPLQDLAILKIEKEKIVDSDGEFQLKPFSVVKLGDSSGLQIGQTIIAIGNALGEFRNTVSVGVISGLGRTITASGGGFVETIEDVIQTDAAINKGNSGGPLLNLKGEVIGINTATVLGAQSIGFAIPVNKAKRDIEQVKTLGKIVYPFLGVYYVLITENLAEEFDLPVDYGAWIGRNAAGEYTTEAIFSDSAAEKSGIERDDIILEFGGEKITPDNSLAKFIQKYNPGDKVALKILQEGEEKTIEVILGERNE
ncbi:MAG TPA: trypsin-like peptidase domain-containing protein [Candidatus Parcubacteria bacterium]|jgi:serine protease Do|nr:trypsin-like peptidase domain-containing protein [Candidatus Parcubacteria bacterium]